MASSVLVSDLIFAVDVLCTICGMQLLNLLLLICNIIKFVPQTISPEHLLPSSHGGRRPVAFAGSSDRVEFSNMQSFMRLHELLSVLPAAAHSSKLTDNAMYVPPVE